MPVTTNPHFLGWNLNDEENEIMEQITTVFIADSAEEFCIPLLIWGFYALLKYMKEEYAWKNILSSRNWKNKEIKKET